MDCGARRQENGYVLRIRGSEYLVSEDEWTELLGLLAAVDNGAEEAVSNDFAEAIEESQSRQAGPSGIDLVGLMGLRAKVERRF
jgi:hypothetical protein